MVRKPTPYSNPDIVRADAEFACKSRFRFVHDIGKVD
jgi:hypothetical protein